MRAFHKGCVRESTTNKNCCVRGRKCRRLGHWCFERNRTCRESGSLQPHMVLVSLRYSVRQQSLAESPKIGKCAPPCVQEFALAGWRVGIDPGTNRSLRTEEAENQGAVAGQPRKIPRDDGICSALKMNTNRSSPEAANDRHEMYKSATQ
jgi:hypothetical protein